MVLRKILESDAVSNKFLPNDTLVGVLIHAISLSPFALLIIDWLNRNLTADPIQAIMQRTGQVSIIWLFLSLSCTPLFILFEFRKPLKYKKILGLYAFFYSALHFLTFFVLDYRLNLSFILADINNKSYIFAGLFALIILTALAITSIREIKKRMGKMWKRLHRLVYAAGLLAVIHYIWVVKADIRQPLLYAGILLFLLALRVPFIREYITRLRKTNIKHAGR